MVAFFPLSSACSLLQCGWLIEEPKRLMRRSAFVPLPPNMQPSCFSRGRGPNLKVILGAVPTTAVPATRCEGGRGG